ncbi:MAG: hypothetical protein H0V36_10710 [Chloroflexi bacterium]|nr:hypothetical protein [Chloroflexota bacterium]
MTAVEIHARMGTVPNESLARLRAAESLVRTGRSGEGRRPVRLASDAFQRLGATRLLRQAAALVARAA